jgi:signal transduction histidine kinase
MKAPWKQLRTPQGGSLLVVLLALLVLLPVWYFLGNWYQANLIQQERAKAAEQISARANGLASAVDQRVALLQGLYAFTRTEWPDTDFDRPFEIYSAGVYFNSTGLRTLMIAPEGIARYIFPISDSPQLSGYDILNDPDPATRNDVQRAIRNRGITLGQPGELRQGGFGLTAWQAVYRGKDLWGLVSIAVDMNTVLKDSGLADLSGELDMAVRDSLGHTFSGPGEVWQRDPVVQTIGLPEGAWELGGAPQEGWVAAVHSQADVFRLNSLVIAGLIAILVYLTVNRQGQLAQAVALRTREIAAAQQELEQRVQERTHELSTLLDVSRRIGSTLALDPLLGLILTEIKPVLDYTSAHIFRLDETGRLVLASAAGGALLAEDAPTFSWLDERHQNQVLESLQPVIEWDWAAGNAYPDKLCWMGVPLVIKDRATGMLAFIHQDPHYYRNEDARLALTFAQQVAVAIENARLYEQAGQLAVLEERQRLARELHDSVSQVLYSIGLGAKAARAAMEQDTSQIADALDYVNWLAEAGQVEMHALIFELRPESLRTDGLVAALEKQAAVLHTRHQMAVQASFCPEPAIPLGIKETLYRISQEAIHNIVKHAHATRVTLVLECSENQIYLEVTDNGIGFDPLAAYPGHLGLKSMRERAVQCLGRIQIDSAPDRGTKIQFVIPLERG